MGSRRLTIDELVTFARAAADNALRLGEDALLLVRAGRSVRGYALSVLALEEFAKFYLAREFLQTWPRARTVQDLRKAMLDHPVKYTETLDRLWTMAPVPLPEGLGLAQVAQRDLEVRNRALYVDIANDGSTLTPDDVGASEAERHCEAVHGLIAIVHQTIGRALTEDAKRARANEG